MNELDYSKAVLLGILQGITEFLPISSSGHLALAQRWLQLDPDGTPMLLFDILAHLGTLLAVMIVFRRTMAGYLSSLCRRSIRPPHTPSTSLHLPRHDAPWRRHGYHATYAVRPLLLAIVATIPTAAIGLLFQRPFEAAFDRPRWIGVCLLITGGLLAGLAKTPRGRRGWKDFRWPEAVAVGIAQGLAILPGISRSGATICTACYLGWRRRWAAEFSFLIIIPPIVGGTMLELADALKTPASAETAAPWGPIIAGSVASLLVGVGSLALLLRVVRRAKLPYFAPYCWLLGASVILVC